MSGTEKGGFISKAASKLIGDKKRWRAYKTRKRQLPDNYAVAVDAIEKYLMYFVPAEGVSFESQFEDLADLFEQAAADGTPVSAIVGEDPVEFVETFARNYSRGAYVPARVQKQLTDAIARAGESEKEAPR